MKISIRLLAVLLALGSLATAAPARATTVVSLPEHDLIADAVAIVIGRVTAIESRWEGAGRGRIVTHVTVALDEVLKGELPVDELTLKQPGGRVQGVASWVEGSPEFKVGERVLLFLRLNADGTLRVAHLYQGKFSLVADAISGEELALRAAGPGVKVLGKSGTAGTPATDTHKLDDLKAKIRAHGPAGPRGRARGPVPVTAPAVSGGVTEVHAEFAFFPEPSRWFEPDSGTPVPMSLNSGGEPTAPGLGFDQIRAGYGAWNAVSGSSFRYRDDGFTSAAGFQYDGVNAVSFRDPYGDIDPPVGCGGTLAIGGYYRSSETRVVGGRTFYRIIEGDIVFADGWSGCGFYESFANLAEVATHELGHVLGLDHSGDADATMYPYAHWDGRGAALRADDMAGVRASYPAPTTTTATLSVVKAGTGGGTVTSDPAGISCGADCSEAYASGTTVTLGATPASGSTFAGWSGACSGTGACTVTVSAAASATATFNTTPAPVPPPPTGALNVIFTSPAAGATVSGTAWVTIWVEGASGTANAFSLAVGGAAVASQTTSGARVTLAWNTGTSANGTQTMVATVRDAGGKTGTASRAVTVQNSGSPAPTTLTASFTSPAAGATVSGTITVGMAASGASGTSTTFTLAVDGVVKSTQTVSGTTASYGWNTTTATNGAHTLTLTVKDGAGRTATATRTVTVSNGPASPTGGLKVIFTTPAAGATVRGTVWVNIWVEGAGGTANAFTLSVGGKVVATQTIAGTHVTLPWSTPGSANGPQTLTGTVRDATGKTGSATRAVTVGN